jgi:hypothetical protein
MSQYIEGPVRTFIAGTTLSQHARVKLSGGYLAVCGASDVGIGTVEADVVTAYDGVGVRLHSAQGTRKMIASGAITAGNPCYAAASGKIASSGTVYCGIALETSANDGDIIEVLPVPNTDLSTAIAGSSNVSFEVDNDSETPKIALSGQAAGSGDYTTTLKPESTLSADNAIIVPEADGDTLAAVALAQTLLAKTLGAGCGLTTAAITAAGTGQGDAADLTALLNTATGNGTVGVKLPTAVAGLLVCVYNLAATDGLKVYPNTSDDINDGSANAAVTIEGKTLAIFLAVDATTWAAIYTANT